MPKNILAILQVILFGTDFCSLTIFLVLGGFNITQAISMYSSFNAGLITYFGHLVLGDLVLNIKTENCCQTLDVFFSFCYLDGANSIKTDLHICNLWNG